MRQNLRLRADEAGKALSDDLGDPGVELLAAALEEALIGGVLDESVLEDVGGIGRNATAKDDLALDEPIERRRELGLGHGDGRSQQFL